MIFQKLSFLLGEMYEFYIIKVTFQIFLYRYLKIINNGFDRGLTSLTTKRSL